MQEGERLKTVQRRDSGGSSPGRRHPKNRLNDLTGREWLRFTRTWFVYDPPPRSPEEVQHPAKYPEGMVEQFLRFFTKEGEWVLDPFCGVGSTLVAARQAGRNAVGVELAPRFAAIARRRLDVTPAPSTAPDTLQVVAQGDATGLPAVLEKLYAEHRTLPAQFDFTMTSPPYWNMLSKSRGGVESVHKKRARLGLATTYTDDPADLGNRPDYGGFLAALGLVFRHVYERTRPGRYLVVVAQNMRTPEGVVRPFAWDLVRELTERGPWTFHGERIWCQDSKPLGIWGYPKVFVPNYHHHYCLIFYKTEGSVRE